LVIFLMMIRHAKRAFHVIETRNSRSRSLLHVDVAIEEAIDDFSFLLLFGSRGSLEGEVCSLSTDSFPIGAVRSRTEIETFFSLLHRAILNDEICFLLIISLEGIDCSLNTKLLSRG
ncbi:hypothetical protein PENTCL1PPCAC_2642, partial [Pristionchus entomophagus]